MAGARETKLVRARVGGGANTLVLRGTPDAGVPLSLVTSERSPCDDVLAVTYRGARSFLDAWRDRVGRRPRNVGIVSVGATMRATATASGDARNLVRGVPEPTDVPAIRRSVESYLDSWPADGRTVVCFDSVSTLLDRVDADAATTFLGDVARSLAERDVEGYFSFAPSNHDEATVRNVCSLFDTVVEYVADGAVSAAPSATSEVPSATPDAPSEDDCFDAVADARRRRALALLASADGGLSSRDLAESIAEREGADRRRVETSLVQVHLPKLVDRGLVADDEGGRFTVGPHFERVKSYLNVASE